MIEVLYYNHWAMFTAVTSFILIVYPCELACFCLLINSKAKQGIKNKPKYLSVVQESASVGL